MDCVPLLDLLPDQAPDAVQEVVFVADQLNIELAPFATVLGLLVKLTTGVGNATDTVADCEALPPAPVQVKP